MKKQIIEMTREKVIDALLTKDFQNNSEVISLI